MGVVEDFSQQLAEHVVGKIGDAGQRRLSALVAARTVMPDADVYDRIRLARYILTGCEEEPAPPDYEDVKNLAGETVIRLEKRTQDEDYPFASGDVLVLGPEIFASTEAPYDDGAVINWRGRNFVPQQESEAVTGVVGPDPEFGPVPDAEDADMQAMAPPQTVEEVAGEREPAPSAGRLWAGRRGGRPA